MKLKEVVNKEIYSEMENFGLLKDDINRIRSIFLKYTQIEEALIYGSGALDTYKPSSDIDITIIGKDIDLN